MRNAVNLDLHSFVVIRWDLSRPRSGVISTEDQRQQQSLSSDTSLQSWDVKQTGRILAGHLRHDYRGHLGCTRHEDASTRKANPG